MRLNCALITTILLVFGILGSKGAILQRNQRDVETSEVFEERKDQIPVAVIEVQEPDTVVQSLQVDTAIQTTFDNAAENEQEIELKDSLLTEQTAVDNVEHSTEGTKLQADIEITTELKSALENELKQKPEILDNTELTENQQKAITSAPTVYEQTPDISLDQTPGPSELVVEREILPADADLDKDTVTDADVDPEGRQNTPNGTPVEATTPQNFVQFIQNTPIGQFFTQLTGGQQQQQQAGGQTPAGATADVPQATPTVPVFLNPGVALTQAQQVVQNAAQSVVNTTTQAIQGLQQFASNIGNQFQNTISSLSGQNQQNAAVATTSRPPGPIQAIVSNFVGGNQATTSSPGQPQGPFQGIISFFQGGQRPLNNAANQSQNQANKPSQPEVSQDKPNVDDKIETQEPEITNEVRNSEEALDSFEESQSGQDLIVVNDDASLVTEQTSTV